MTKDGKLKIKRTRCGTVYYCLSTSSGIGITKEGYYLKIGKNYMGPFNTPKQAEDLETN